MSTSDALALDHISETKKLSECPVPPFSQHLFMLSMYMAPPLKP